RFRAVGVMRGGAHSRAEDANHQRVRRRGEVAEGHVEADEPAAGQRPAADVYAIGGASAALPIAKPLPPSGQHGCWRDGLLRRRLVEGRLGTTIGFSIAKQLVKIAVVKRIAFDSIGGWLRSKADRPARGYGPAPAR